MGFIGFDPFGGRCFTAEMAFGEWLFYFVLFVSCACLVIVVVCCLFPFFFSLFLYCWVLLCLVGRLVGWLVGWLLLVG